MNTVRTAVLSVAVACGLALSVGALAHGFRHHHPHHHHPRAHVGIWFGVPVFPRYHYYPRYYYPAPTVIVPAPVYPPVYIEQPAPAAGSAPPLHESAAYWYYCPDAQTYYPYVQQCASPWQRVVPHAPPS